MLFSSPKYKKCYFHPQNTKNVIFILGMQKISFLSPKYKKKCYFIPEVQKKCYFITRSRKKKCYFIPRSTTKKNVIFNSELQNHGKFSNKFKSEFISKEIHFIFFSVWESNPKIYQLSPELVYFDIHFHKDILLQS